MKPGPRPAASLDKIEALLRNPALYELADVIPEQDGTGRPRVYPSFMVLLFDALVSVYRSARQVEAELAHPLVWGFIRRIITEHFPDDPNMQLPKRPMRRHHYTYMRDRYLTESRGARRTRWAPSGARDRSSARDGSPRSRGARVVHPPAPLEDAARRWQGARTALQGEAG